MTRLSSFLLIFLFFLLGCDVNHLSTGRSRSFNPFPELRLVDLKGAPSSFQLAQEQVVFVNFWGTWCSSCRHEMRLINRLYRRYHPLGVSFVGIALDSLPSVLSFLRENRLPYPVFLSDVSAVQFLIKYGNKEGGLPFSLVFHTTLRASFRGALSVQSVRRMLDTQLCRLH